MHVNASQDECGGAFNTQTFQNADGPRPSPPEQTLRATADAIA